MVPTLPDPTEDLHWSDFSGPIHQHFAANAVAHPGRRCVVETSPYREFTYQQIHEASNVLAHHLLQSGLERGDVVMLYSYRGVDLVVAIMGVLKAGGTFSVIDPLYPADRQIIYLEVAKPRALVVIKRATETAGGFDAKVTLWIADNLNLKTAVPELVLEDDGSVRGGLSQGKDVLEHAQASKASTDGFPDIGPDDIPTLSFTSGSEGKPKGVRGRHFSLPHYFPWMSERFGLSPNERFTMLSGIAHDPIQRDIFTPLFLGASLWVPSSEDIQHETLANWMAKYETTVTHLTPAMGQILVGGASTQFPALRNAFFVGDVLIKRDVRKLQALAPNATIINMFGTTETQRAVSYFAVSSRSSDPAHLDRLPDIIPAGRGMNRVQLLVVDRANKDRICGVEEPGEIYVRAAGLAEGYLGAADLNKEKFIESWFVNKQHWIDAYQRKLEGQAEKPAWAAAFEPRDRLYRSGDLGYYNQAGDVVCTGRADNQVKIRGFRVELGDIDSKLSGHELVRENVTLLRKEKEQLVSFVVPDFSAWKKFCGERHIKDDASDTSTVGRLKRFEPLRDEVRKYLKTKLAIHEVPALIVPLLAMPLNPNGKPDRPKLLDPTPEELNESRIGSVVQLTPLEGTVAEIWAQVLGGIAADTIRPEDNWMDLGGDSLKANKMLRLVTQKLRKVQQRELYAHPALRDFALLFDTEIKLVNGVNGVAADSYGSDADKLVAALPAKFATATSTPTTFFLTGATGFLGSFVLANLLNRPNGKVIALVRGRSGDTMQRIRESCTAYGLWSDSWTERLTCVAGDLSRGQFGLEGRTWEKLCQEVDAVIHNGARVDWLLRYSDLKAVNVQSTMTAFELAATSKAKSITFVSSTAVLDTEHYLDLAQSRHSSGGIPENDNLEGSRSGLSDGYGQTKWVSEYLMREAGRRGLAGCIVRPGYVLGDSKTGASITDDFLIRMLKGVVQTGSRPPINHTINMVPVNHVARIVAACAMHPPVTPLGVAHVTPHPRLTWNDFLGSLETLGYRVPVAPSYESWRDGLLHYIEESEKPDSSKEAWAATPLLDLVTSDFPNATRPRLLDDRNAQAALSADGAEQTTGAVTQDVIGLYVAYLVKIGFMPGPSVAEGGKALPEVEILERQMVALKSLGGRGRVSG